MEQPDGSYPRLNGQLLQSGGYHELIVSFVGKFETSNVNPTTMVPSSIERLPYTKFSCCDGYIIELNTEHTTVSPEITAAVANNMVFELIGQVNGSNILTVFVVRPLSSDMDLQIYNQMVTKVQHNPKYMKDYFPYSAGIAPPVFHHS